MFEAGTFDTEHIVIGKTVAKSVGITSEYEVREVFSSIEGRKNFDLHFANRKVVVEWSNRWDMKSLIKTHTGFRIMPANVVPTSMLSMSLAKYDTMRSKPITRTVMTGNWFDAHTERQQDEDDLGFEHRIVKTLARIFEVKRKPTQQPAQPITDMSKLDQKIFFFNDSRVMYSVNEIKTLVTDKVTAPNEIVRLTEGLAFRAGTLTEHTQILNDLLSLTIDTPAQPL